MKSTSININSCLSSGCISPQQTAADITTLWTLTYLYLTLRPPLSASFINPPLFCWIRKGRLRQHSSCHWHRWPWRPKSWEDGDLCGRHAVSIATRYPGNWHACVKWLCVRSEATTTQNQSGRVGTESGFTKLGQCMLEGVSSQNFGRSKFKPKVGIWIELNWLQPQEVEFDVNLICWKYIFY